MKLKAAYISNKQGQQGANIQCELDQEVLDAVIDLIKQKRDFQASEIARLLPADQTVFRYKRKVLDELLKELEG